MSNLTLVHININFVISTHSDSTSTNPEGKVPGDFIINLGELFEIEEVKLSADEKHCTIMFKNAAQSNIL